MEYGYIILFLLSLLNMPFKELNFWKLFVLSYRLNYSLISYPIKKTPRISVFVLFFFNWMAPKPRLQSATCVYC